MKQRVFLGAWVSWAALLLPLLVFAQSGKGSSPSEWEKTIEAAKRDGTVVVSIPTSAELRKAMEAAFHKRFDGIRLELVAARGSASVNRILEEKKTGVHYFDVHVGGTSSIVTGLLRADVLEPLLPWLVLPEVQDPKHWWGGHMTYMGRQRAKVHLCFSRLFDRDDLVQLELGQARRSDDIRPSARTKVERKDRHSGSPYGRFR